MSPSMMDAEIASQPEHWRQAAELVPAFADRLPEHGSTVAVVGCGTSWYIAQAYAALREGAGLGHTDAFAASEFPTGRRYDRVLAITRSGTTTEIHRLLARLDDTPSVVVTGVPAAIRDTADAVVDLAFCDELSVVQTRFATSALALLRAHLGEDLSRAAAEAERVLQTPVPESVRGAGQFTFLGTGWTVGIASEAALKLRESAACWSEAYPALEYRHGPISVAEPGRVTWIFGAAPAGLAEEVRRTGAIVVDDDLDPMADLVRVHRLAGALAADRGLNPDAPRHLSRSVVLA
ncbi:fructoselysine-6-P-deglycase FrlB-like protein [Actinoalloteichus hoggarensis]|uniref:Glutamine--fructose-6-phosphate aminotransferase [isomerizing] n=1 Tax=Actinoalloteichus hoggarensis TaxID=1470176 RepID=A0A221W748_9PSEU|nr:sugar isomerase [Actinoalloteichus hoggarensis]ASO21187.1 Glutamine--fructose-6-phosphate aminotransferase [isomerizing] [Actinoalloteichus hoggarensis]MBB5921117.1 fructoselysine-6-P-deglycase FrlB-like protein [Actinoalloteichus hoggarensis]